MVDMTTISAATTSLNFVKDASQVVLLSKVEFETQKRLAAGIEKLGSAQDVLYQLRDELFRLQEENAQLRRDLAARDEWEAQKARSTLTQTGGGALVYASNGPPAHWACPVCFATKTVHILQDVHDQHGTFYCPSCKTYYSGVSRGSRQTRATRSVSDDDRY